VLVDTCHDGLLQQTVAVVPTRPEGLATAIALVAAFKLFYVATVAAGHLATAARHLPQQQSGQQLPSLPASLPRTRPQLTHVTLQQQQQVLAHRTYPGAAASGGSKLPVNTRAKPAWAWGLAIAAVGPAAHSHSMRQLTNAQEGMMDTAALGGRESLLQASSALARTRISAAVESGAAMAATSAASRGRDLPLRRALLQGGGGSGSVLTDSLRGVSRQERAAASVSMIRSAAAGEMDVGDAIRQAQAAPSGGTVGSAVIAERAAGRAAAVGTFLP
jgi:hypothetical protein